MTVVGQAEVREPATVDEHQGVVRARGRAATPPVPDAEKPLVNDGAIEPLLLAVIWRTTSWIVCRPGRLDVFARDRLDRRGGLGVDPLDVGARDVDPDVLRGCGAASDQCDSADAAARSRLSSAENS